MRKHESSEVSDYLEAVVSEIGFKEARDAVRIEMNSHIEESIEAAKSFGLSEARALEISLAKMGAPDLIGQRLNQIHRPKIDLILAALLVGLCAVGLWNLSSTKWISLQIVWITIGASVLPAIYFLPIIKLRNVLASLYPLAILGLVASYFSGVTANGQPYLSLFGINLKIVDLSAVLFSLALPALATFPRQLRLSTLSTVTFFVAPLTYFLLSGFIWAGLLLLVSGLCFLGHQKISDLMLTIIGVVGAGLLLLKIPEGLVPVSEMNKAVATEAHTDYVLRSLSSAHGFESIAFALLTALVIYGLKASLSVKEPVLRSLAIVSASLISVQIIASVLANLGVIPMLQAGINIPFMSYGGSGVLANFLIIAVLLACLKRKTLTVVDAWSAPE